MLEVSGSIGDPNAQPGPPIPAPKSLAECTTLAEALGYLCEKYRATYERLPTDGHVRVTLITADGDRTAGVGADTNAAVQNLLEKLGEL